MSFTKELWSAMTPIYAAILRHPFLAGLTDGSLPRDALPLLRGAGRALPARVRARALAGRGARAPRTSGSSCSTSTRRARSRWSATLHEGFFREFGLSPAEVAATPLAPTNVAYTSYLLAVAYGAPFHEALAALLPCYWIYWEVGKALERSGLARSAVRALDRHLRLRGVRRAWCARCSRATDAVAARLGPAERDAMHQPLPHDQPLRVDVLGHGLAPRGLAGLSLPAGSGTPLSVVTVPPDARHRCDRS